jgi:hypothetical protein
MPEFEREGDSSADITVQFRTHAVPEDRSASSARLVPVEIFALPHDKLIKLKVQVFFHASNKWVEVSAEALGAEGVKVQQLNDAFVRADIIHRKGVVEEQCTVRCPKTGESRTGRNACIECVSDAGTVKICC